MGKRKPKADVSELDSGGRPGVESSARENLLYMESIEALELRNAPNSDTPDPRYGTPLKYDPSFNGPIKKRSCTDVICCLLFFIFILGLLIVAYFAFAYGNPKLLLYPVNSEGELCGFGKQRGKPNLFFFDLVKCGRMGPGVFVAGCPTPQVCVQECPKDNFVFNWVTGTPDTLKYCIPGVDTSQLTGNAEAQKLVKDDQCAAYYMESKALLHRCVPTVLADLLDAGGSFFDAVDKGDTSGLNFTDNSNNPITNEMMNLGLDVMGQFLKAKEYAEKVIQDVVSSWYMILACLVIAMLISLIWIVLMRWLAGPMVYVTILAFIGLFGFGCYWCFMKYIETKDSDEMFTLHMGFSMQFEQSKVWLGLGITAAIILALTLLILLFLCQRIRIAIQLIKMGSKAVGNMMFTLLFPVFPFVLQLGTVGLWAATAVFLASTGREQSFSDYNSTFPNGTLDYVQIKARLDNVLNCKEHVNNNDTAFSDICGAIQFAQDNFSKNVIYLQIFNLFMLFWMANFFIALGQMTLAGAFASYYWAFNKPKDIPTFPLAGSFWRCFRYHLGSLAFGSLIIAIVQIIRVFLDYLDSKLKSSENAVAKFFLKCLKCCFWCLEKFLKFLNKNAYIMVAVYGKNFCVSAKNAFMLLMRNCVRVVVVDKVTDFLLFIGKLVIVGAVGAASFFFFNGQITFLRAYNPSLNFYFVPVVLVVVGSYIVASCFFSVYSMAVDTLFLCFLEDLERNDGTSEKPYYMPKGLMKLLNKKNKKLKDTEEE